MGAKNKKKVAKDKIAENMFNYISPFLAFEKGDLKNKTFNLDDFLKEGTKNRNCSN